MESNRDLLINFIQSKTGVQVSDDSIIFDDLGIDGLDAETFMEEFAYAFKVDLSNFDKKNILYLNMS